jgi:hypothetical protein
MDQDPISQKHIARVEADIRSIHVEKEKINAEINAKRARVKP